MLSNFFDKTATEQGFINHMDDIRSDEGRHVPAEEAISSARDEILKRSGTLFDPELMGVLASVPIEVWKDLREAVTARG
jgi:hypothetical protein